MNEKTCINDLLTFKFGTLTVEVTNDPAYRINSADNNFTYDFAYGDNKAGVYLGSNHGVKILSDDKVIKSAVVCGASGGTGIHSQSATIINNDICICCANNVFSLSLPDLKLNWLTEVDMATCFGIYKADNGLFIHGEMSVARLNYAGQIIWQTGLRDIIVYIDGEQRYQDAFVMLDNYIALIDFSGNKYQLGFDGKFISKQIGQ